MKILRAHIGTPILWVGIKKCLKKNKDKTGLQRITKKQSKTARSNNKNQCHQYQSLEILRNTPMLQRFDLLFLFDPAIVASPTCPSEQKQLYTEIRCHLSESKDVHRFSTYGRVLNIPRSSFICIIVCATLTYVHMLYQSIVRNKGGKRIR